MSKTIWRIAYGIILIVVLSVAVFAQDKKDDRYIPGSRCETFSLKAYSDSTLKIENAPGSIKITDLLDKKATIGIINLDELPDKIIIHCSDENEREQDITLTRKDLFRLLQFVSFLLPQINQAWEMDQPRNAK